ncbi:hypothetical protein POPTR_013G108100v4 [Populus trichocarpa]|uniref:Uncharacterized protein n=1 Tax=Populus trichocarpa TaxID=3694 RepID=A0ACC0S3H4_POPTR|nr:protein PHOTOSYSTEM I ASSEMBLY 2, chloroplastic [Populus trichocarpa]KAI9383637.1 hypothetical protein POPTR_013G108100v4 [Populus trichocarpa]
MTKLYLLCGHNLICAPALTIHPGFRPRICNMCQEKKVRTVAVFAAKSGGFSLNSILNGCKTCGGKGAMECAGCKGTGKNKKNGNIFERWKCFDCQGFGLKSCPSCGKGGLTPEQRGER